MQEIMEDGKEVCHDLLEWRGGRREAAAVKLIAGERPGLVQAAGKLEFGEAAVAVEPDRVGEVGFEMFTVAKIPRDFGDQSLDQEWRLAGGWWSTQGWWRTGRLPDHGDR